MESTNVSYIFENLQVELKNRVKHIDQTMVFMYIFTAVFSIVGNTLVIIVLRSYHRNHCLSSYKINLAIADLCIIVFCVPFTYNVTELEKWVFGAVLCPLILFLQLCCVCSSAYTNVAIGLNRFLAVIYPLENRQRNKNRILMITMLWLLAAAVACPILVMAKIGNGVDANSTHLTCSDTWSTPTQKLVYTMTVFVLVFIIPIVLLSVTYSCVVYTLWRHDTPGNAHADRDRRRLASKKRITWMLISVVALFVVCWLPLHVLNIVVDLDPHILDSMDDSTVDYLFFICHWIGVSHAFVNPIIYVTTDSEFRASVWKVLTLKKGPNRSSVVGNTCSSPKDKYLKPAISRRPMTSSSPLSRNIYGLEFNHKQAETVFFPINDLRICENVDCPNMTSVQGNDTSKQLKGCPCKDSRFGDVTSKNNMLPDRLGGSLLVDNFKQELILSRSRLANMMQESLKADRILTDSMLQKNLLTGSKLENTRLTKIKQNSRFTDNMSQESILKNNPADYVVKPKLMYRNRFENILKEKNLLQKRLRASNRLANMLEEGLLEESALEDDTLKERLLAADRLDEMLQKRLLVDNLLADSRIEDNTNEETILIAADNSQENKIQNTVGGTLEGELQSKLLVGNLVDESMLQMPLLTSDGPEGNMVESNLPADSQLEDIVIEDNRYKIPDQQEHGKQTR